MREKPQKAYILTKRAAADLREARTWSRARWGKELTNLYFDDLHKGAQYVAECHPSLQLRQHLAGGTALLLHPVREHYLIYEPLNDQYIVIVAVIRQRRDIPAILQKWAAPIRRELAAIRAAIDRKEIALPGTHSLPKRKPPKPKKSK